MSTFTATTVATTGANLKTATAMVAEYRENGGGSNRTDWVRLPLLTAAVLTVVSTGKPVDITDLFAGKGEKLYHLAHRAIGMTLLRPYWGQVQVVALKGATYTGKVVTGETDTARGTTVLLCPTQ